MLRPDLTYNRYKSAERTKADGRTINTATTGKKQTAPSPVTNYRLPLTPDEPEEDDRPAYDPYADDDGLEPVQAETDSGFVSDDEPEEVEPYIPSCVSNPQL